MNWVWLVVILILLGGWIHMMYRAVSSGGTYPFGKRPDGSLRFDSFIPSIAMVFIWGGFAALWAINCFLGGIYPEEILFAIPGGTTALLIGALYGLARDWDALVLGGQ